MGRRGGAGVPPEGVNERPLASRAILAHPGVMHSRRIAAFFDLDGTLLTVNSGLLWMRREFRVGRIGVREVGRGLAYLLGYRFGVVDAARAFEEAGGSIRGLSEETLRGWTHEWYETSVRKHAARGSHAVVAQHREAGHLTVLLTTASMWEAERAIEHFGLDHALATRFESTDGVLTGRVVEPLCYGPGKVQLAEAFAREHGVDLDRSFFYTDSITDLPMLERVGEPRVVHPDPRLARVATRRGYVTLDWRH